MVIHLPHDLENSVRAEVLNGHFASADDVVAEAVRAFLQQRKLAASPMEKHPTQTKPSPSIPEAEFKQQLIDAGLMISLPAVPAPATRRDFQPIAIEGEPLSETIIRVRR